MQDRSIVSRSYVQNKNDYIKNYSKIDFDLDFPIVKKDSKLVDFIRAQSHMKLPTRSKGFVDCYNNKSEVSCYEIVHASEVIKKYEESVSSLNADGYIYVDVKNYELEDRMTMLYHALAIAIATERYIYVNHSYFPFKLPSVIFNIRNEMQGTVISTDYTFSCSELGYENNNIILNNITWPQAIYTHFSIAPFLRAEFGFHAAYYLGNYLFGSKNQPENRCQNLKNEFAVEVKEYDDDEMVSSSRYYQKLWRCGVPEKFQIITHRSAKIPEKANSTLVYDDDESKKCGLYQLISSKYVVHTFGSRLGWWAMAMHGNRGGFINPMDFICVNVTVSQSASLWHTYTPEKKYLFITNNRLFNCGINSYDVRLYIDYLLW